MMSKYNIISLFRGIALPPRSKLYSDKSFYSKFVFDLENTNTDVIIESPFLTMKRTVQLAPTFVRLVERDVHVEVVTRSPSEYDAFSYVQISECIMYLRLLGINVKTTNKHYHRKVAIIDDNILWEGSLNILSQNNSIEIMRRTNSKDFVKQMELFIKFHK